MLEVSNLSAFYGGITALTGVSLKVDRGEAVAILGRNGAGKTTLLRAISGLVRRRSGEVRFEGKNCTALPAHAIARLGIGHVPEGRHVFPPLSVLDNLRLGTYSRAARSRADAPDRALDRVFQLFPRLAERRRQAAGTLSGGEQQMLAIGRALMAEPSLLLLDEPSLGLSPVLVDTILEALQQLNRSGLTVLLVEQNMHVALDLVSRAYVLNTGQIVLHDSAARLRERGLRDIYLGKSVGTPP